MSQPSLLAGVFAEDKVPEQGVTLQVTGQVAHRKPNIKYKKNEVFLDVEERVHCTLSHDGTILTFIVRLLNVENSVMVLAETSVGSP